MACVDAEIIPIFQVLGQILHFFACGARLRCSPCLFPVRVLWPLDSPKASGLRHQVCLFVRKIVCFTISHTAGFNNTYYNILTQCQRSLFLSFCTAITSIVGKHEYFIIIITGKLSNIWYLYYNIHVQKSQHLATIIFVHVCLLYYPTNSVLVCLL